jgi:hypothetical protein
MHLVWKDGIDFIDFEKSKFKIKKFSKDLGQIQIRDYGDLKTKQGELGHLKMIHNYVTIIKDPKYDLFIHPLNLTVYISELLKNSIIEANLTGIDMASADNLEML